MVQLDGFPEWHQHLIIRSRVTKICTSTVLSREELLWTLCEWDPQIKLTQDEARLLVKSSLRRSETLWFWISLVDSNTIHGLLKETLLSDEDRDKSDASNMVVNITAAFLNVQQIQELKSMMSASPYTHFQKAVPKLDKVDDIHKKMVSDLDRFLNNRKDPSVKSEVFLEEGKEAAEKTRGSLAKSKHTDHTLPLLGQAYYYSLDRNRFRRGPRASY
jgi:hypothetical protein